MIDPENLPSHFCAVPFTSIIFDPFGNVLCCRELGKGHILGNIRKQSWQEIWNGEKFRAFRNEFLTGNIQTCKKLIAERACHRFEFNVELQKYVEFNEVQSRPPTRLSPDFNGFCNLRCEMCTIWSDPNGLYDELNFWEDAEETLFPFLQQIDPLHGEPLLQKDTFRLINVIAKANPDCAWRFTTNGHFKLSPKLKSQFETINLKVLNISLDSIIPESYAKIRERGKLEVVLEFIKDIVEYKKDRVVRGLNDFQVLINTTIQQENMHELVPFIRFANSHGKNVFPFIQVLKVPEHLSILSLPHQERFDLLLSYLNELKPSEAVISASVLNPLYDSLDESAKKIANKLLHFNVTHDKK